MSCQLSPSPSPSPSPRPRSISSVYQQILKVIPSEEIELRKELSEYIDGLWNIAPEAMCDSNVFIPFANILSKHIRSLEPGVDQWKFDVRDIFSGTKTIE